MKVLKFFLKSLSFLPAILIMYMIFSFSAQDSTQSSRMSYGVSYKAVSIVNDKLDLALTDKQIKNCINKIEHYIRKLAHFTEYFLLAVSISIPLYVYGVRGIWLLLLAGIICVGYASTDEFHQLFVSGRGASPKDVFIDSCGSFTGIIFVRIFGYISRKTIFEPLSRK
jgi:VanZ family protein